MTESPHANAFTTALQELQAGQTLTDLHHALIGLVGAVQSVGKKGTLTLTITLTPKANSSQLILTDDVKVAEPKPDRDITILFADNNNRLTRRDPRQPRLSGVDPEVRAVPVAAVNTKTGEIAE